MGRYKHSDLDDEADFEHVLNAYQDFVRATRAKLNASTGVNHEKRPQSSRQATTVSPIETKWNGHKANHRDARASGHILYAPKTKNLESTPP